MMRHVNADPIAAELLDDVNRRAAAVLEGVNLAGGGAAVLFLKEAL